MKKVYFVRRYEGNLSFNHLYLGSTNATINGFKRNVEFLLHLQFAPYKTSYDSYRNELINDNKECMFEKLISTSNDATSKADVTNELLLRKAITAIKKAKITVFNSSYSISVQCDTNKLPNEKVYLYPLGSEGKELQLSEENAFKEMQLALLTEFYVIRINELRRVIN